MTAGMVKRWCLIFALLTGQAAAQLEASAPASLAEAAAPASLVEASAPASLVEAPPPTGEVEPSAALAAPAPSDPTDAALMDQLSQQLRNPAWLANPGEPCGGTWQGVSCSEAGRVTSISLAAYSQLGAIPAYLSGLTELLNLTLSSMQMNGTLPTSWGIAFRQLQWLDLSGNSELFLWCTTVRPGALVSAARLSPATVAVLGGNSGLHFVATISSVSAACLQPGFD